MQETGFTVQELIDSLSLIEDKTLPVYIHLEAETARACHTISTYRVEEAFRNVVGDKKCILLAEKENDKGRILAEFDSHSVIMEN
ncbi:MAG: hypothetical protein J6Y90_07465 [Lachnospiraceae bacterium]|nr:hypothetical protein [Lachnospiraceae bacterium]